MVDSCLYTTIGLLFLMDGMITISFQSRGQPISDSQVLTQWLTMPLPFFTSRAHEWLLIKEVLTLCPSWSRGEVIHGHSILLFSFPFIHLQTTLVETKVWEVNGPTILFLSGIPILYGRPNLLQERNESWAVERRGGYREFTIMTLLLSSEIPLSLIHSRPTYNGEWISTTCSFMDFF